MATGARKLFLTGLLLGLIAGSALTAAGFTLFGDRLKFDVATATSDLGEGVQRVGKEIEKTGDKMR